MRKKKGNDPQAKAKRQKKIAIAGGLLLAIVVALQGPGLLKQLKGGTPATLGPPTAAAQPGAEGATSTATPLAASKVPADPDPAPAALEGQLVTFSLFKSKDPFAQQLSASAGAPAEAGSAGSGSGAGSGSTTTPPATTPPATTPPATTPPATTPPASTPPATTPPVTTPPATTPPATTPRATTPPKAPTAATISINGTNEVVQVGAAFPQANPLFRLAAIKDGVAQIGIAGGSLQDGAKTVPLSKGKPLTLMNTADGTKYVLQLVSVQ